MERTRVSVIIPTYKRSKYLIRAINSILNQSYDNIEIIVVDDNGIGDKFQLINEKNLSAFIENNQIIYIKHEQNKNGAAARNTGIKVATGDYITFLDDDDFFLKKRIELLVKKLENNRDYDCAYSSMIKIKNNHIYNYRKGNKEGNLLYDILSQYSFFGTGSNMFFTKKSITEIGQFDEKFFRYQDLEYMARFFEHGFKVCSISDVLVVKCEEDAINFPNYEKLKLAKEMYVNKFIKSINKLGFNDIMYAIYRDLYIFSSNDNHQDAIDILNTFKKVKVKDTIIYLYNKLTINYSLLNKINYKIREIRCIGKYTNKEKREIFLSL